MFEKEIKFISDFCLNKVKHLGSFIAFDKLETTELHPAILRYISAELDFMIFADRSKIMKESFFDYSGKEISGYFTKISNEIKKIKKISIEDLNKLITQAVSFNANYVVRPKWSLTKLIYNNQQTISADELEIMLSYIYYYDYIKNVLAAYLSKRSIEQLSLSDFDMVLDKIDRELFKTNSAQLIDNALISIGDFFNIGGVDKNTVPPLAVEIFLKEKNLVDYLVKLKKSVPDSSKKKYDANEIKKILYAAAKPVDDIDETVKEIFESSLDDEIEDTSVAEDELPEKSFEDIEIVESETSVENGEQSLGELAERHAEHLEKSDIETFLSPEDEEALLALYEEELKVPDEELNNEQSEDDNVEVKKSTGENNEETGNGVEKQIINEMMDDYFNVDEDKARKELSGELQEKSEPQNEATEEAESSEQVEIKTKKNVTFEDELMEVLEEIDLPGSTVDNGSETIAHFDEEIKDDLTDEIEIEESSLYNNNENDEDLNIIDEITFEEDDDDTEDTVENNSETPAATESGNEEISMNEHADEREDELIDDNNTIVRKRDLFNYLKRKEVKKIIKDVFGGDEVDFVITTEKIMDCSSYKEASDIIKSVFTSYKISPYSKEAINLTNAVSNYFRQA